MGKTLGHHVAKRLVELGCDQFFCVPGDYNLMLIDTFVDTPGLKMINTTNELNAGYAADGYARVKGIGCVMVTFTVGGLSVINAVAGAYSESLPLIVITGGPNSNDYGTSRILHHTTGLPNFHQEAACFKEVTAAQVEIYNLDSAKLDVDAAIAMAIKEQKPVYINICCNLAAVDHPSFSEEPVPFYLIPKPSNPDSLEAAITAAAAFLDKAVKPVLVGGVKLRQGKAQAQFKLLAEKSGMPVAVMPNAKGMYPEDAPGFMGTYWGQISSAYCAEIVESSDAYLFAGPIFNDYTSVGYSLLIKREKMVEVQPWHVTIGGYKTFTCVSMGDFLKGLAARMQPNDTAFRNHERMFLQAPEVPKAKEGAPLRTNSLFKHVQAMLAPESLLIAETGDSWFNCQKLKLPPGCGYEFQCQYGSIGWSVGATLGSALALQGKKRVISCIGDGSFQVTATDLSTIMRYETNPLIFLINNGGYTIEVEIHDGPYNVIKNWDYVALCNAMSNGDGKGWATRVSTEEELIAALNTATSEKADQLCLLECMVHKDDCSRELLEWGSRVAAANGRPANPQ
ncbi:hypothetical protein WJX84_001430 [Apatococcus fuscideae]|uniref:pyruvate decarboxylase n=1 Tax=Apatococcus fuscideae TaxID=2026836 RepID=A0AAW1SVI1_9CHLO